MGKNAEKNRAVFIDRDGTLIHERHYLRRVKDVRLFAGAVKALRLLKETGYKIILITNQSGIGRGYFTEKKLHQIHDHLGKMLLKKGIALDGVYYCPHHPEVKCECRKPKLGLVKQARKKFNLDLKRSFTVGDHTGDFLLGQNMGGKGIFVLTGHGREEQKKITKSSGQLVPDRVEKNILTAARWITAQF